MPLDADAAAILDVLKQMPLPEAGADAAEYRALQESMPRPPQPIIEIDRVEDLTVDGPGGTIPVRFYADGPDVGPRPTLVYMHGGGFVLCSIDTHDAYCRRLAQESGWAFLSVDYRLAPEHRYPAAFEDCYAVLQWAASAAAAELGIDGGRLAVGGDSAGGALAAALALAARDRGGPALVHQMLIYPVVDNALDTPSYRENGQDYFLTTDNMAWFWQQYLGEGAGAVDQYAAPGRAADLARLPPATIITAGYDPLRDEAADYARRLEAAGVPVAYRCYDGAFHGFAGMEMLESATRSRAFLVEQLRAAG